MEANDDRVRVSAAAVLRIRALAGGQYVLANTSGKWAPFGGAFQMDAPPPALVELGWEQESRNGRGRDVRGTVPRSALPAVHAWLASGADRESGEECVRRELREELAEVGVRDLVGMVDGLRLRISLTLVEPPGRPILAAWRYLEMFDLVACTAGDTPERWLREQILGHAKATGTPRITTVPRSALTRRHAKASDGYFEGVEFASHAYYVTTGDY